MGLFEEIEKRKNVYTFNPGPLTQEQKDTFMKRMYEMDKKQANSTIVTSATVAKVFEDLAIQEQEAKVVEMLLEVLSTLYIEKIITAKRYTELEQLLLSDDLESKVLATQIIKSLYKKEIVIEK